MNTSNPSPAGEEVVKCFRCRQPIRRHCDSLTCTRWVHMNGDRWCENALARPASPPPSATNAIECRHKWNLWSGLCDLCGVPHHSVAPPPARCPICKKPLDPPDDSPNYWEWCKCPSALPAERTANQERKDEVDLWESESAGLPDTTGWTLQCFDSAIGDTGDYSHCDRIRDKDKNVLAEIWDREGSCEVFKFLFAAATGEIKPAAPSSTEGEEKMPRTNRQARSQDYVWAGSDPFTGAQVLDLLRENEQLRSAICAQCGQEKKR